MFGGLFPSGLPHNKQQQVISIQIPITAIPTKSTIFDILIELHIRNDN